MTDAVEAMAEQETAGLRALAERVATDAGRMIRDARRAGAVSTETKSTITDLVTEYDRRSEALIVDAIRRARPGDGVVGEEGAADPGTTGISWLIDPIDGTTNYVYGLAGYCVSIAACDNSGPRAAAVYLPATDELFSAARGRGATLDAEPIRCSSTTNPAVALVATGFSYQPSRRRRQMQRLTEMIGDIRDIRRVGAAAADLCYVACGRVDAYFEEYLNPWDLAAGQLIASEAGCTLGDFSGGPPRPDQVLVAAPGLFAPLQRMIAGATAGLH